MHKHTHTQTHRDTVTDRHCTHKDSHTHTHTHKCTHIHTNMYIQVAHTQTHTHTQNLTHINKKTHSHRHIHKYPYIYRKNFFWRLNMFHCFVNERNACLLVSILHMITFSIWACTVKIWYRLCLNQSYLFRFYINYVTKLTFKIGLISQKAITAMNVDDSGFDYR